MSAKLTNSGITVYLEAFAFPTTRQYEHVANPGRKSSFRHIVTAIEVDLRPSQLIVSIGKQIPLATFASEVYRFFISALLSLSFKGTKSAAWAERELAVIAKNELQKFYLHHRDELDTSRAGDLDAQGQVVHFRYIVSKTNTGILRSVDVYRHLQNIQTHALCTHKTAK